jgi:hypothetical protein
MTDEPMKSGHIHRHGDYGRAFTPDLSRCRASVGDNSLRITRYSQCRNKVVVNRLVRDDATNEVETLGYCRIHDPVNVAAKQAARQASWDAKWNARQAGWAEQDRLRDSRAAYLTALLEIERGHNDPRQLARDALLQFGDMPKEDDQCDKT